MKNATHNAQKLSIKKETITNLSVAGVDFPFVTETAVTSTPLCTSRVAR